MPRQQLRKTVIFHRFQKLRKAKVVFLITGTYNLASLDFICPIVTVRMSLISEMSEIVNAHSWPTQKVLFLLSVMLAFTNPTTVSDQYQEGLYKHHFHMWRVVFDFFFYLPINWCLFFYILKYFIQYHSENKMGHSPVFWLSFWYKFFVYLLGGIFVVVAILSVQFSGIYIHNVM